jgi:hypothetical protein
MGSSAQLRSKILMLSAAQDTVIAHDSSVTESYAYQSFMSAASLGNISETIYMTDMPASSMFMRDEEGM